MPRRRSFIERNSSGSQLRLLFLPRLKALRANSVESTEVFHRAFANGDTGMHGLGQRPVPPKFTSLGIAVG
jgi:hypothetical protein